MIASKPLPTATLPTADHESAANPSFLSRWDSEVHAALEQPTVLIVDDIEINRRLLKAMLKTARYRILEARRASEALAVIETEKIDLVVVDLILPEMSGPDLCRLIKGNRHTQLIPVLMLTSVQGVENEIAGISSGADEFLLKPLHPTVLRTRIRAMLRNKALFDSLDEAETILFALAQSVERRDPSTGQHCERLASYSVALGMALGLENSQLLALHRGGYLHDIGKISVPDAILFKPGKLTAEEWAIMRAHTVNGEAICRPMKTLGPVLPIIRGHHERWDGSGYPDGLRGEEIPLLPRILQVTDIYDALTTVRSYKPALSHDQAIQTLNDEVQRGWRDPELVPLFSGICAQARQSSPDAYQSGSSENETMAQSLERMSRELLR